MWGRERYRANLGMVPALGKSSSNRGIGSSSSLCRTHGRTALGSSRGGSDGRRGHNSDGGGSGGGRRSGGGRAKVGPACRGRRGAAHPRFDVVSFAHLHHGWARERDESFEGDGEEMEWLGMKMKGGGGGGGGGGGK